MTSGPSQRKIGKLKEKYNLSELDDQLRFKYNVEDESLRDLANYVNVEVTKKFLDDKPFSPEFVYTTLQDPNDTTTLENQKDLERRLRMHDVDADTLKGEWVTHMSVRSYLQKDLDINTERETKAPLDPSVTLGRIQGLLNREEKIIWENIEATAGIDASKWDLQQELTLVDKETGKTVLLREYLNQLDEDLE